MCYATKWMKRIRLMKFRFSIRLHAAAGRNSALGSVSGKRNRDHRKSENFSLVWKIFARKLAHKVEICENV